MTIFWVISYLEKRYTNKLITLYKRHLSNIIKGSTLLLESCGTIRSVNTHKKHLTTTAIQYSDKCLCHLLLTLSLAWFKFIETRSKEYMWLHLLWIKTFVTLCHEQNKNTCWKLNYHFHVFDKTGNFCKSALLKSIWTSQIIQKFL